MTDGEPVSQPEPEPAASPSPQPAPRREVRHRSEWEIRWRQARNAPPPVVRAVLANVAVATVGGVILLLTDWLASHTRAGDQLLVKGSRSAGMERILPLLATSCRSRQKSLADTFPPKPYLKEPTCVLAWMRTKFQMP